MSSLITIDRIGGLRAILRILRRIEILLSANRMVYAMLGAMVGLGSGEQMRTLHNPDYDLPDEFITTGVGLFCTLYTISLSTFWISVYRLLNVALLV